MSVNANLLMATQPTKPIRVRIVTSQRLDKKKLIERESYDGVINRVLDEVEKRGK